MAIYILEIRRDTGAHRRVEWLLDDRCDSVVMSALAYIGHLGIHGREPKIAQIMQRRRGPAGVAAQTLASLHARRYAHMCAALLDPGETESTQFSFLRALADMRVRSTKAALERYLQRLMAYLASERHGAAGDKSHLVPLTKRVLRIIDSPNGASLPLQPNTLPP